MLLGIFLVGCDLQPKISSLPDSISDFISDRYPALLADPKTQPEIYNSAANDYGIYAAPELYGNENNTQDYVLYASVQDYVLTPEITTNTTLNKDTEYYIVKKGDTLYSLSRKYGISVKDLINNNALKEPYILSIGQKITVFNQQKINKNVSDEFVDTQKIKLQEVHVGQGDTLYSLSRKYSIPINDLAVINQLSAPFILHVGQSIKIPILDDNMLHTTVPISATNNLINNVDKTGIQTTSSKDIKISPAVDKQRISSDPKQELPKISLRSSSKFSWPIRGNILSKYGAKHNGLFNDGINISASKGSVVKAAENGVVAYAGNEVKGMGNLIIIQHSDGWMTIYAHLDSMKVRRGHKVQVGQYIGTVGVTGKVDVPQLHFEIRKGTKAYNPSSYLKK